MDNNSFSRSSHLGALLPTWTVLFRASIPLLIALLMVRTEQLRPKLILGRYRTEHARAWWQKAELPSEAFWGGEVAAQLVTRYLKPETVTIYAESNLPKLQVQYGLRRDSNGDIELLGKFWKFDQWEQKHLQTAPPLLIYADLLMTADDRNLETAEIIYDRYIARLVE